MTALLIVDHPEQWPLEDPIRRSDQRRPTIYASARFSELRQARVYNLCDS